MFRSHDIGPGAGGKSSCFWQWNVSAAREAVGEVKGRSWIAGPEGVPPAAEPGAGAGDLGDRVHCTGAGTLKP